jgi:hypothetical protein
MENPFTPILKTPQRSVEEEEGESPMQRPGDPWERAEQYRDRLDPQRLHLAAEAALRAAHEVAAYTGGPMPYPLDLMGGELQPDYLAEFTRWEIEQACAYLVRMGLIEQPQKK